MSVVESAAFRGARNQAAIDLADTGAGVATLKLYTAQGDTLLATRSLLKPCATLDANSRIALAQDTSKTELVLVAGAIGWAEWCDASGVAILGCTVTDQSGAGPLKMPGTDGTNVQPGGIVTLLEPLLIG